MRRLLAKQAAKEADKALSGKVWSHKAWVKVWIRPFDEDKHITRGKEGWVGQNLMFLHLGYTYTSLNSCYELRLVDSMT